jgi:hypothetical protein
MSPCLVVLLTDWIKEINPDSDESTTEEIKECLAEFVDKHTLTRSRVEKQLTELLYMFKPRFSESSIELRNVCSMYIEGKNRQGRIELDSLEFDSSEDLSSLANYASEMEDAAWDDDLTEELIEKWFDLKE